MNRRYSALLLFLLVIVPATVHPYRNTLQFRHISSQDGLSQNTIYTILQDSRGFMWFGTQDGLNRFDRKTETCIHYRNETHNPRSLNNNSVLSLCEDKDGTLWIGTNGGGLNKFDKSSETFQHYTKEHGLPNNVVYGIVGDEDGYLWLSTNNGISRFDPDAETFRNYTVDDGLQSNEFMPGGIMRRPNRTGMPTPWMALTKTGTPWGKDALPRIRNFRLGRIPFKSKGQIAMVSGVRVGPPWPSL